MKVTSKTLFASYVVCKYSGIDYHHEYHICPHTFFFGDAVPLLCKAVRSSREILMFLAAI